MILNISARMTDFLLEREIVRKEDREIYLYGFEAMLSTIVNIVLTLTAGLVSGLFSETLIFMISFAVLRVYSGGYHAKTHTGCILTFAGIYAFSMAAAVLLPQQYAALVSIAAGAFSLVYILINAPIEHKNRPFVDDEYRNFRRICRMVAVLEAFLITILLVFFVQFSKTALVISLAMLGVTFILALAKKIESKG